MFTDGQQKARPAPAGILCVACGEPYTPGQQVRITDHGIIHAACMTAAGTEQPQQTSLRLREALGERRAAA